MITAAPKATKTEAKGMTLCRAGLKRTPARVGSIVGEKVKVDFRTFQAAKGNES